MTLAFPSPEFDDAVAAVCHGVATDAEMRALNELLRGNSSARDEYLVRVVLHSRLASDPDLFCQMAPVNSIPVAGADTVRLTAPGPQIDRSLPGNGRDGFHPAPDSRKGEKDAVERIPIDPWLDPTPPPTVGSAHLTPAGAVSPRSKRKRVKALALAAGLAVFATGVWSLWFKEAAPVTGPTSTAVAMLTRVVDARWSQGTERLRVGSALDPGWLRLESGLAQVVFYSGARVVIEGPAELRLVSASEAELRIGALLAEVPRAARGFRLKTDHAAVVDLGTEFGIDATPGQTEVHVFEGKVELHLGSAARQSLGEGQAAVVAANTAPRLLAASAVAFTPLFEFQQRSVAAEAYRHEQWQFANARLNQDPSLVVHLDFQDLNGSDWTLRNAAEQSLSAPEATIVGCQRAEGRWREKQALEFQSVNDRLRLSVPGEFDALTLSAWVRVSGLDREFNSLFMCDGFEPGTIHWLIRRDGVLGLTVFGPGSGNFQILASPPVLTLDKFGMWLHLAVVLDGKGRQAAHYVNGSPVARHTLKLAPPFRLGSAELGNWNARSGQNPAPFLIRNLSASLDEFELFRRALSDAEVRELYAKGKLDL